MVSEALQFSQCMYGENFLCKALFPKLFVPYGGTVCVQYKPLIMPSIFLISAIPLIASLRCSRILLGIIQKNL